MSRPLKVLIIGDGDAGKTSLRARYLTEQFKPAYRATIGADFVSKTIEVSVPVPRESKRRRRRLSKASSSSSCHSSCCDDEEGAQKDISEQPNSVSRSSLPKGKGKADLQKDGKVTRPKLDRSCSSELAAATAARHQEKVRVTLSIWDTAGQERFRSLGTAFYRGADAVIIAFDVTKKGSLARTISWYRDFCMMGDLGDESDPGLTPKQSRLAKQQKERFCWVAVGCKGDLLSKLSEQKSSGQKTTSQGVSWQSARTWFDGLQTRYLPNTQSESNAFADVDPATYASDKAKPYAIDGEIPADPEDVLSRPSPTKPSVFGYSQDQINQSAEARHPQAGTPPGNATKPGQDAELHEQPTLQAHGRLKGNSLTAIEIWQEGLPVPNSNGTDAALSAGTVSSNGYERSRYDSTTSQSGNSIYYSIRGSAMMSQSPTTRASNSPKRLANGLGSSSLRSYTQNDSSRSRNESVDSRFDNKEGSPHTRKQSTLSGMPSTSTSDDDETKTEPQNATRPSLKTNDSEQTERGPSLGNATSGTLEQGDTEDENDERTATAISSIPSGDPIPFPSEDDVTSETDAQEIRARRRKRLSRMSQKRQSIATQSAVEASEAEIIAEATKEQREQQQQEILDVEEEEEQELKRRSKHMNKNEVDRRMTLYSARPSSTTSTIRPADADFLQDDEVSNDVESPKGDGPTLKGQEELHASSSLRVLDVESDESDAESNLYEDHLEQGFRLFYTSAKTGTSIDDVFQHIAYRVALRWTYEEWEEAQRRLAWGYGPEGQVRTAPPTNEEIERERLKRAIKISQGKGTGGCCS